MSNHLKAKPRQPIRKAADGGAGGGIDCDAKQSQYTPKTPPLSSILKNRRLDPRHGALIKLDFIENRLANARAVGDDTAYGRYYSAWMRLHRVAFDFEKMRKASDV